MRSQLKGSQSYHKNSLLNNFFVRIMVPPVAGFLFYGTWAFWVNSAHGVKAAAIAGSAHGSYSFVITLVSALMIEWLFRVLQAFSLRALWTTLIALLLLYVSSYGVNALAGTPNIWLTILPGAGISTVYTILYVVVLVRQA